MTSATRRAAGAIALTLTPMLTTACVRAPASPEDFRHDPPPAACEIRVQSTDGAGTLESAYLYGADGRLLFAHTHPWYEGDAWLTYEYDERGRVSRMRTHSEHSEMDAPCLTCRFRMRETAETSLDYDDRGRVVASASSARSYRETSLMDGQQAVARFMPAASSSGRADIGYSGDDLVRWSRWRYVRRGPDVVDAIGPAGLAARYRIEGHRVVAADVNFCSDESCAPWLHGTLRYEGRHLLESDLTFVATESLPAARKRVRYTYDGDRIVSVESFDSQRDPVNAEVTAYSYDASGRLVSITTGPILRQTLSYAGACPNRSPRDPIAGEEHASYLLLPRHPVPMPGVPSGLPLGWTD